MAESLITQAKKHANSCFGFTYSLVSIIEKKANDGVLTDYVFSIKERTYRANVERGSMEAIVVVQDGFFLIGSLISNEELKKAGAHPELLMIW